MVIQKTHLFSLPSWLGATGFVGHSCLNSQETRNILTTCGDNYRKVRLSASCWRYRMRTADSNADAECFCWSWCSDDLEGQNWIICDSWNKCTHADCAASETEEVIWFWLKITTKTNHSKLTLISYKKNSVFPIKKLTANLVGNGFLLYYI